ncbi:hypothetical protein [Thalassospira xiamenensis]|jgi:hypothetical protein|uniref:hypothetical protein n=1 Tax=Thalassospira xiamenensis TaxID=220697 RepID=UPI000DEDB1A2|nr:hypothetical protein [Thalassospira xiamenensis]MCK2169068.1 hypothetical protein [Thalassospira xiamenensis]RCK33963.1 hypothetical protein TH9_06030 [Thalassospira xiamenensis]
MKIKSFIGAVTSNVLLSIMLAEQALAQGVDLGGEGGAGGSDKKWYSWIVDGLNLISEGVGAIVAVFLGLGLMVWGGWGALTGKMDPKDAFIRVIGGIISVAGPLIADGLLSFIE